MSSIRVFVKKLLLNFRHLYSSLKLFDHYLPRIWSNFPGQNHISYGAAAGFIRECTAILTQCADDKMIPTKMRVFYRLTV